MNKTISVNIGGRVFNIEENAFEKLNRYLNTIRGYFEGNDSADEIISDIELRVAELFMERITDQKQVIMLTDVDQVITIMGKPEDYLDSEEEEAKTYTHKKAKTNKRVFRDPDNKVVFGVCGGISAYFGWDPIVLRALFVVGVLFFGTGVLLYIILAIVIPNAMTTADKLRMRGESVTVDNISKKVNESFTDVKEDIKDFGQRNNINKESVSGAGRSISNFFEDLTTFLGKAIRLILSIAQKIIGLAFFLLGIGGIIFIAAVFFGHESFIAMTDNHMYSDEQVHTLIEGVLTTNFQYITFYIGAILVSVIPSIAILLLGIRMLFDFKRVPGITAVVLLIIWLIGVGMLSVFGFNMFREFHVETEFTERVPIELPTSDTLFLDITNGKNTLYRFSSEFDRNQIIFDDGVTFQGKNSTDIVYEGETSFTVEINRNDTVYELFIERSARGANHKDAVHNARQVQSNVQVSNDTLMISPLLILPQGTKIRNQEVKYILSIPVGKSIHFSENAGAIIYDVPNVTSTLDRRMLNKTWTMTEDGLMNEKVSKELAKKLEKDKEAEEILEEEIEERERELERLERSKDD